MPHELGSQVSWLYLPAFPKNVREGPAVSFGGAISDFRQTSAQTVLSLSKLGLSL